MHQQFRRDLWILTERKGKGVFLVPRAVSPHCWGARGTPDKLLVLPRLRGERWTGLVQWGPRADLDQSQSREC